MRSKILIADLKPHAFSHPSYEFEHAYDGLECLDKIRRFKPDLLIADLFLPKMHGIEILTATKIPTIITSFHPLIQNYKAALSSGALYFLNKPYTAENLYTLLDLYFSNKLQVQPFSGFHSPAEKQEPLLPPQIDLPASYLKFWGTRGSSPVSGPSYARFGGNTPCLEVRQGKDLVIFDAGTGLRPLSRRLGSTSANTFHIFLSHTHWDHLAGLPFFLPLYQENCEVHLWAPVGYGHTLKETLLALFSYPYFPVRLEEVQSKLITHDIRDGETINIGSIQVQTAYAFHPGATFCFKISTQGRHFGYATDNEILLGYQGDPKEISPTHPLLEPHQQLLEFFQSCDTLIHEAQYSPTEYQKKVGWGHSSVSNAAVLARCTHPKEWIVTHHDPKHTDEELEKKLQLHVDVLRHLELPTRVRMAFDDFVLPL